MSDDKILKLLWITASLLVTGIGIGGVFVMRYFLGKILNEESHVVKTFYIHVGEFISSALIVFGVTFLLGETELLSKYVQRKTGRTFIDIITQPEYLRKNFNNNRIKEIRIAATQALCIAPVDTGSGSFLNLIENTIYPMLDNPLRYDLEVYYGQQITKVKGKDVLKITHISKWTYKNPRSVPIVYPQIFQNKMEPIDGIKPKDLFKITEFKVNGKQQQFKWSMDLLPDHRYLFSGKWNIEVKEKENVDVELKQEKFIPYQDHFTLWMEVPTKNIKLTYKHPDNFEPRIYVFGLGEKDVILETEESDLHVWKYQGWLLKKHGLLLYWVKKE